MFWKTITLHSKSDLEFFNKQATQPDSMSSPAIKSVKGVELYNYWQRSTLSVSGAVLIQTVPCKSESVHLPETAYNWTEYSMSSAAIKSVKGVEFYNYWQCSTLSVSGAVNSISIVIWITAPPRTSPEIKDIVNYIRSLGEPGTPAEQNKKWIN